MMQIYEPVLLVAEVFTSFGVHAGIVLKTPIWLAQSPPHPTIQ